MRAFDQQASDQQISELLQMTGVVSVCLVELRDGGAVLCFGADDTARAAEARAVLRTLADGPLCREQRIEDVVITEGGHHLLYAAVPGTERCLQVRMVRDRGSLGFVLHRLRAAARAAAESGPPPGPGARRRSGPAPDPVGRVERPVLERVLAALRSLSTGRPHSATVTS
ncbi:hypothetical protein [Nocardiopsis composta]|uniref:Roadblock/LAMTOR2 domain-containing protein n=1 Tax=Nocardiopsis composta TaxID=157465 RepID=A0A7W8QP46_9ACTN|nr:hypothetical protein [Nocardiopsis composta]MBB5433305.1 hypothetical protein [Nocardiopsis composta]